MGSLDCFILSDQVLSLNRWSTLLSELEGCFGSKDVLFEKVMLDMLFQVLSEGPTVDDLVSLTIMAGAIYFCSRKREIIQDWSRTPNPQLVVVGVEYLVDGEPQ